MTKTKPMTESIEGEKTKIEGRNWGITTNSEQLNIYLPLSRIQLHPSPGKNLFLAQFWPSSLTFLRYCLVPNNGLLISNTKWKKQSIPIN